jgi:uncharacterized membrane protein YphA (DoxX/SURF4 family)
MSTTVSPRMRTALDVTTVIARWFLAVTFIYMGLQKALDPVTFLKLVRQYEIVKNPFMLNAIASSLPFFEIACGLFLLFGVAVRGTAVNLIAMLVPFTLMVLRRALEIAATQGTPFCAIKFDCGCGNGEVIICHKLIENTGLLFLSCWLLSGFGRQLCARFSLLKTNSDAPTPVSGPSTTAEYRG